MSIGITLLAALLKKGVLKDYLARSLKEKYFKPSEQEMFLEVDKFIKSFGAMPSSHWLEDKVSEYGIEVPHTPEVEEYYYAKFKDRYVADSLKVAMTDASSLIKNGEPHAALIDLVSKIVDLSIQTSGHQIVDLRESFELLHKEYKTKQKYGDDYGIKMGWPSLDAMTGGLMGGDMVSYVGRPAQGKTFNLLYSGHYAWYHQKVPTLVVSMEMIPLLLIQRITAMHTHYNLTHLKNAELSTKAYNKVGHIMTGLKDFDVPFWIVNGNLTATVDDIWALCKQLKPELVLIDGAYLVHTGDKRMGKFERIGAVAEATKSRIATDLNVPVISSYQFNRDAVKKKKGETAGLEDIYGSDVIAQVSSVVLALLEDDSVETITRRKVDILKGRSGEVGQFFTNWDFWNMDFSEFKEDTIENLKYL